MSLLLDTHSLTGCGRQVGTANDEPVLRGTWTNQTNVDQFSWIFIKVYSKWILDRLHHLSIEKSAQHYAQKHTSSWFCVMETTD